MPPGTSTSSDPANSRDETDDRVPFWSVMIPTYRPSLVYLRESLGSVLDQAPSPDQMQIEIVDDASPDTDVAEMVRQIAGDRASVFINPQNVGLAKNWNMCIERARGTWVHILHQDDKVVGGFYQSLRNGMQHVPQVEAAFTRHAHIDPEGHWIHLSPLERSTPGVLENFIDQIAVQQRIQCPSIVVRKSLYDRIGSFATDLVFSLDWEMWRRIACNTSIWYDPAILALYRLHPQSATPRLERSGENIADIGRSIEKVKAYLPPDRAERLTQQAKENYAAWGLHTAKSMLLTGDFDSAAKQANAALKLCRSKKVLRMALSYYRKRISLLIARRPKSEGTGGG